jgi:hypothetical protein
MQINFKKINKNHHKSRNNLYMTRDPKVNTRSAVYSFLWAV